MGIPEAQAAVPEPLEHYARQFEACWHSAAQRRAFREYVAGLLLPHERHKTLTALAGTEPVRGAQHPDAQRLQYFLSEASWEATAVNDRRVALLVRDPATRPHANGVLVLDDTGDRKDGTQTAHVARQYLGSIGKVDNGIVAVTSVWADERVYWPAHVLPYTPAGRLPKGRADPDFRTKPQLARELVNQALAAGISFRAIVADCFYGDNLEFEGALRQAQRPYVLALRPSKGAWVREGEAETPEAAARQLDWTSPEQPGDWTRVVRTYRDGHTTVWWAAEARFAGYGPDGATRLVVATTDPATLPPLTTWYLAANLPRPGGPRVATSPFAPADLAEVVRLYGLRNWVEQSYKQVKDELGWADFQVRTDRAIRRHWTLVLCAFSFCWDEWFAAQERVWPPPPPQASPPQASHQAPPPAAPTPTGSPSPSAPAAPAGARGKKQRAAAGASPAPASPPASPLPMALVAGRPTPGAQLARPLEHASAHRAGLVAQPSTRQ